MNKSSWRRSTELFLSLLILSLTSETFAACSGRYTEQTTSTYILSYKVGESYLVGQGNCTDGSHEIGFDQAHAYDFDMPIGTNIIATKSGTVVAIEKRYIDGNATSGKENFIIIKHTDSKFSGYYHLTRNGALPELGSDVAQGEIIALSGNTGDSTEPHFHFEVLECRDCDTIPINFINTRSHSNGLEEGQNYAAKPFRQMVKDIVISQTLLE